jgi:hypothetical protein
LRALSLSTPSKSALNTKVAMFRGDRCSPPRARTPGAPLVRLWGAKIRFLLQTATFSLTIPSFGTSHAECGDVQRTLACAPAGTSRSGTPLRGERLTRMDTAAAIVLVLLVVVLPAVVVGGLFVWAAFKDGQEDRALRARLGIRRRTRLGR